MDYERVRAKFNCTSKTEFKAWNKEVWYQYKFQAVIGDTEENKTFFASTPSGSIELGAVKSDLFEVGQDYYLDFIAAG